MKNQIFILPIMALVCACSHKAYIKPVDPAPDSPTIVVLTPRDTIYKNYSGKTDYVNYLGGRNRTTRTSADKAYVTIVFADSLIKFKCSFSGDTFKWRQNGSYYHGDNRSFCVYYYSDSSIMIHAESNASRGGISWTFNGTLIK